MTAPQEELENVVKLAIDCLRAQILSPQEQKQLEEDVEKALHTDAVLFYL